MILFVIFTICLFHFSRPTCIFEDGKYDLSDLDWIRGWPVSIPKINGELAAFEINICRPVQSSTGCVNSSVCLVTRNGSTSYGDAVMEKSSNYAISDSFGGGFSLYLLTEVKCGAIGVYRAAINFACGPYLGAPELILRSECQANFYWRTLAACKEKPKVKQVPCYVIDDQGNKRDLSPLIMPEGGYFVNTPTPAMDFVINVCGNIVPDNKTEGCPDAGACRIIGSEKIMFGTPRRRVLSHEEGLTLTYTTLGYYTNSGCRMKPKTTVTFKCPSRGHSQPPKIISDSNCQYDVEWETEYACPENTLKGSIKDCKFSLDNHGVEIDLTPLKMKTFVNVTSSDDKNIHFALSVCSGLNNYTCGDKHWKSVAACMANSSDNSFQVIGTTDKSNFMYADQEVILTYPKGAECKGNGVEQSSTINFVCDLNAGVGEPTHLSSDYCAHIFEWRTKHACLKNPLDTPCSVTYDKKKVNLQKLLLLKGDPWEAVDRRVLPSKDNAEYYINVCGQVSNLDNSNLIKCGESSSVCVLLYNGTYLNLGNFTTAPVYDEISKSIKLHYVGGSFCNGEKSWSSTISFVCRPGHINSGPVLTRINDVDCIYEFQWLTAEACPEGIIEGINCKVYDSKLDINYDLNSLRSKTYQVDTENYKYYLGVCEPVQDTPCSANKNSSDNVGVCQVDKVNNSSWKTGEPTSHLSYMDGVVNLTYLNGDPYNDANNTARMTMIIFICDYHPNNNSPYFVEEVDFAYVFHWYTDLVCPKVPSMDCLVHDPVSHLVYDLSGLALTGQNWVTIISEDNKERQIYLNVCKSLAGPTGCNPDAAVCAVEITDIGEKVVIPNLGRVNSPPLLDSPGHLSLTYTNGDPCRAFGENTTYSTVIHFLCGEQISKNGPIFLSRLGACEYAFLWNTKAACPTANLETRDSCQLTDIDSGFTFDLSSLYMNKQPYVVQSPSRTFQLNICGKINQGCTPFNGINPSVNVSACETDNDGNILSELAISNSYSLSYSDGQYLTLTYKSNSSTTGSGKGIAIKFPCTLGAPDQSPVFIGNEGGQYVFEMKTSLTCMTSQFDCNIVDTNGNEYDLNPLAKYSDGNWEAVDHRPEYSHLRYYINFCRPLNKVSSYNCPGGNSAACQVNTANIGSNGIDLGSQKSDPLVSHRGTVVIRYVDGSLCQNGQFSRSTTINLFCSSKEGDLIFIGETPECEFVFSLDTPAACPIQNNVGNNCMVKDPIFGYMFDLNPLKSKNNNYNVTVGEYVYLFNVCGKLNGLENVCANSSSCQTKPSDIGFSKSLGLPNDDLVYRKGLITLEYQFGSGNCHGKYNRSTKITFTCHHGREDKDGPYYVSEAENCTYLFEWPTVHACPPFDVIECSAVDENGTHYDLSKLSLLSDNYYVKYPFSDKNTFVINVCRSVVHTSDSLCPYTSAVCLVDNSKPSEPLNLGRAVQAPYIDDGKIKMRYSSGDPCNEEHSSTARFWQTIIEFSCSEHNIDSSPQFVGKDDCTYYFDWPTAYACPAKTAVSNNDCTALDPTTNFQYNLTALKNQLFISNVSGYRYTLNICGSNSSNPCGSNSGLCQEEIAGLKRSWNGGKPNGNLMFTGEGLMFLNYTGGDECHDGRFKRNTIIEFVCGPDVGEPQFMYETHDCTYFFSWKTELACQVAPHCGVKNNSQYIDLSSFTKTYHTAASGVLNDEASYYISVCGPLPTVEGVFCPPEAGVCRVTQNGVSSSKLWQSLGKMELPPMIDFMGHVTVIYTNGSVCLSDPRLQNRARIIFICDTEAGMGEPVMISDEYDDCLYLFEWRTNVVCPEKPEENMAYCNYTDSSKGIHFDLSLLMKKSDPYYQVTNPRTHNPYFINVCSPIKNLTNCENAGICLQRGKEFSSFGSIDTQQFSYDGQRLRLTYFNGDDCPSGVKGKHSSEIFFVCDSNAGLGTPVLHKRYTCLAVFMWKTSLVCQNTQQQCSFEISNKHYDFNLLSSLSHNWNAMDAQNVSYWINICRGVQRTNTTIGCSPTAAVCMENRAGSHISLGTIQTMEVKSINSTDLLLTFKSGDSRACSKISSSTEMTPTSRIFMRCGNRLGKPKMSNGPDNECYYNFLWESSLACADKAEQVILEENGILRDARFGFILDIKSILNQKFSTNGTSNTDQYVYIINLSGVYQNSTYSDNPCANAAICQTKHGSDFHRDIGSIDSRTFIIRGNELHLQFTSHTRPCGKNHLKNVTTIINMQCSSYAGQGNPTFLYESGNCDYIFEWQTDAACPKFEKDEPDNKGGDPSKMIYPSPNYPYQEPIPQSSHVAEITVGVLFAILVLMVVVFFVVKPERRSRVYHRVRGLFGGVKLPYFRYKRFPGERLVLVDAAQPYNFDDDKDVEMLS
ncbi:cation-independent mannose-6-phosphate receptor isoform X1 [Parasteatoda tepidariorum]|uniref:cation-independent mannose-6-phosphate receptor isoform X1 n=1 Tax=Parasteatoda tepidariorum TaxID=114398 RepID=UPI001C7277BF|nr:cation-independent mannose-6-phosphate receptor isoform X2 [Parasteatoda tepidariorum]